MCNCRSSKKKIKVENAQPLENVMMAVKNNDPNFIEVTYMGAKHKHLVGSTNGVLRQYGLRHYGFGRYGDKIYVHASELDTKKGQKLFVPVETEPIEEIVIEPIEEETIVETVELELVEEEEPIIETVEEPIVYENDEEEIDSSIL